MIYIDIFRISFFSGIHYHRDNGPAYINENQQAWYKEGKCHREDGPAVIDGDFVFYYIDDKQYTEHGYYDKLKEMGLE